MSKPKASKHQIKLARDDYEEKGQIEIDDDAVLSVIDDKRYWVQAWVYIDESGSEDEFVDMEKEETHAPGIRKCEGCDAAFHILVPAKQCPECDEWFCLACMPGSMCTQCDAELQTFEDREDMFWIEHDIAVMKANMRRL